MDERFFSAGRSYFEGTGRGRRFPFPSDRAPPRRQKGRGGSAGRGGRAGGAAPSPGQAGRGGPGGGGRSLPQTAERRRQRQRQVAAAAAPPREGGRGAPPPPPPWRSIPAARTTAWTREPRRAGEWRGWGGVSYLPPPPRAGPGRGGEAAGSPLPGRSARPAAALVAGGRVPAMSGLGPRVGCVSPGLSSPPTDGGWGGWVGEGVLCDPLGDGERAFPGASPCLESSGEFTLSLG